MGYSYLFTCEECKYTQKLYKGWSYMVHDQPANDYLESQPKKLHYKTHQKIVTLSSKTPKLELQMEYRIFRCHRCLQLSGKLYVQVLNEGTILHETHFRCANCHTTLKHTNIHSLKCAICPKCKSPGYIDHWFTILHIDLLFL